MPPKKKTRKGQGAKGRSTRTGAPKKTKVKQKGTKKKGPSRGGTRKASPRKGGSAYGDRARGFLSEEIRHHIKDKGMPQDQAVAAAMSEAERKGLTVPPIGETGGTRGRKGR